MNAKTRTLLAGLALANLIPVGARADAPAATPAAQTALHQAAKELTPEQLPSFLENLGYAVEVDQQKLAQGKTLCTVTIQRGTWTFYVYVSFTADKSQIWLVSPLSTIDEAKVDSAHATRLLAENDRIGPTYFSYDANQRRFYINVQVENRDMSPLRFRSAMDDYLAVIQQTQQLWDPGSWQAPAPAANANLTAPQLTPPAAATPSTTTPTSR